MSKLTHRVLREIVTKFEAMESLVATALLRYERVPDLKVKVRCNEVAQVVADIHKLENSPLFRRELGEAMRAVGIRRMRRDNVAHYRGLRRKVIK